MKIIILLVILCITNTFYCFKTSKFHSSLLSRSKTMRRLNNNLPNKDHPNIFDKFNYLQFLKNVHKEKEFVKPFNMEKGVRTKNEILLSSYYRLKMFNSLSDNLIKEMYLLNSQLNYRKGEASKLVYGLSLDKVVEDSELPKSALIKVCVPSDSSIRSYITFDCIYSDCEMTYQESKKCSNENKSNLPLEMRDIV
jgi:hypothetical protein